MKEGQVSMANNQIISEDEVAEGLVLTCQASCTTDRIIVDFDDV